MGDLVNQPDKKKLETVHMSCRAKSQITGENHCDGTEAEIMGKRRTASGVPGAGAHSVTYRCTKCNGGWTLGF